MAASGNAASPASASPIIIRPGELRITVADEVVPERQFPRAQPLGVIRLLRQVVSVDVAADEPPAGPQWIPEDDRQEHCCKDTAQHARTSRRAATDIR